MLYERQDFYNPEENDPSALTKNPFGVYIYRIDIETIEQFVSEHLKEKLRQLTLLDVRLREEEVKAENT